VTVALLNATEYWPVDANLTFTVNGTACTNGAFYNKVSCVIPTAMDNNVIAISANSSTNAFYTYARSNEISDHTAYLEATVVPVVHNASTLPSCILYASPRSPMDSMSPWKVELSSAGNATLRIPTPSVEQVCSVRAWMCKILRC
jgi:hypothetical protein